jgi:hypothetical protein
VAVMRLTCCTLMSSINSLELSSRYLYCFLNPKVPQLSKLRTEPWEPSVVSRSRPRVWMCYFGGRPLAVPCNWAYRPSARKT